MPKRICLGISPCPNDTFIFYALLKNKIDCHPYEISPILADVQELNQMACRGNLDVVKISVAVYARIQQDYTMLRSGGALGRGCGPVVVSGKGYRYIQDVAKAKMAIPGRLTTANLLLDLHGQHQGERIELGYDKIIPAVEAGEVQAGLVIHEGRFTYHKYGLKKLLDLGSWWEEQTELPIPLGVIVARRDLGREFTNWAQAKIRESLAYAQMHPQEVWPFIKSHAQEMDDHTIQNHIDTFVTEFTLDMGKQGLDAVQRLVKGQKSE